MNYVNYQFPGYYKARAKKESGYWTQTDYDALAQKITETTASIDSLTTSLAEVAENFDKMQKNMNSSEWSKSASSITSQVEKSNTNIKKTTANLLKSLDDCLNAIAKSNVQLASKIDQTKKSITACLSEIEGEDKDNNSSNSSSNSNSQDKKDSVKPKTDDKKESEKTKTEDKKQTEKEDDSKKADTNKTSDDKKSTKDDTKPTNPSEEEKPTTPSEPEKPTTPSEPEKPTNDGSNGISNSSNIDDLRSQLGIDSGPVAKQFDYSNEGLTSSQTDTLNKFIDYGNANGLSDQDMKDWAYIIGSESGFKTDAQNPSSSAYGLGQLLGSNQEKYAGSTENYRNSTEAQIDATYKYIIDTYGSISKAKDHWQANHWY